MRCEVKHGKGNLHMYDSGIAMVISFDDFIL